MGHISRGIRKTMRLVAGVYLLLNLCVATIPRCDNILSVLQHTLDKQWNETPDCHDHQVSQTAAISSHRICECALVKFVFVTLPQFDPQRFIGFRIQSTTVLAFEYTFGLSVAPQGPEPPYPRWTLV
ncbi:MAG: hypothetical protein M3Q07_06240 [Pseudobdellovibrionaceae bacterium]|uniref:hypothetical protein n=1 Tax=Oligoflexus sp. TaxID=1971216 RepID=UPI0027D17477|nr:hypothetical protein [Oligoflexus sp.]MDQ3231403.1 hypothetical protein [Pseudobdellovibrionaceae bacterium]HYX36223.1 hypothetical protein [Oligoflexus sp.]